MISSLVELSDGSGSLVSKVGKHLSERREVRGFPALLCIMRRPSDITRTHGGSARSSGFREAAPSPSAREGPLGRGKPPKAPKGIFPRSGEAQTDRVIDRRTGEGRFAPAPRSARPWLRALRPAWQAEHPFLSARLPARQFVPERPTFLTSYAIQCPLWAPFAVQKCLPHNVFMAGRTVTVTLMKDRLLLENTRVFGLVRISPNYPVSYFQQDSDSFVLGADATSSICADDPHISRAQAIIKQHNSRWWLLPMPHAKNPTWLNGVPLNSPQPMLVGQVIRAGLTGWLILGFPGVNPLIVAATSKNDFFALAVAAYGSVKSAAEMLNVPRSTLARAIESTEFGSYILEQFAEHGVLNRIRRLVQRIRRQTDRTANCGTNSAPQGNYGFTTSFPDIHTMPTLILPRKR